MAQMPREMVLLWLGGLDAFSSVLYLILSLLFRLDFSRLDAFALLYIIEYHFNTSFMLETTRKVRTLLSYRIIMVLAEFSLHLADLLPR